MAWGVASYYLWVRSENKFKSIFKLRRPYEMKKLVLFFMACLLLYGVAIAQDPGFPDTIIVNNTVVDSGQSFAIVPIYAVTDDSIFFYNLPLKWTAPLGGVYPGSGTIYRWPLTLWDEHYDTVITSQSYVRQLGWADIFADSTPNPLLITNMQRVNCWSLHFVINPGTRPQVVNLDTCRDDRNGPMAMTDPLGEITITPKFIHGSITILHVVGIGQEQPIPFEYALKQNYPNPFNPETNIEFSLAKEQNVSLVVFNLLGQQVRTLANSSLGAGDHVAHWDGRNDNGANVPSGIYFYRISTPEFSQTNKMVLVR
jgi:hypothetical protein